MGRLTTDRDTADLIRRAESQGFQVSPTNAGHLRWRAPDGAVTSSSKSPGAYTAYTNHLAWCKAHGLSDENQQERRRRERRQEKLRRKADRPPASKPVVAPPGPGRPKLVFTKEPAVLELVQTQQRPLPQPERAAAMAQRTVTLITCDLHGDDTEGQETIQFGIDGQLYEFEACKDHAEEVREMFAAYVGLARRVSNRPSAVQPAKRVRNRARPLASVLPETVATPAGTDPDVVRAWAKGNGHKVSERGRLSGKVLEAYKAAHS